MGDGDGAEGMAVVGRGSATVNTITTDMLAWAALLKAMARRVGRSGEEVAAPETAASSALVTPGAACNLGNSA